MIKSNVTGCSIMVFHGDQLVATGMSGDRMDLPPGKYTVQAMKEGYDSVILDVELKERFTVVEVRFK
ncbi:MAG: hypothetical protein AB1742_11675 [bacterium]